MTNIFSNFKNFLSQKNVIDLALATTIGFTINNFTNDIVTTVVTPVIKRIFIGSDALEKNLVINIFGIQFEIGKIMEIFVRLLITLFILYLIFKYVPDTVSEYSPL